MLHAIRCATVRDRGFLLQGWYILAWYNGSGVSEQVYSMLHISCYLPTDRLVHRLSLAALRTVWLCKITEVYSFIQLHIYSPKDTEVWMWSWVHKCVRPSISCTEGREREVGFSGAAHHKHPGGGVCVSDGVRALPVSCRVLQERASDWPTVMLDN